MSALFDVAIIGGSFAGLSAAINLGRARRSVLVVDDGLPRNRFAAHSHGVLAADGRPGADLLDQARQDLRRYATVAWRNDRALGISGADPFAIAFTSGEPVHARRILIATGLTDVLPNIPGLAERWGRTVLHCPYCHGYELDQGDIAVIATHPMSAHQAGLVADWGAVTFFTQGQSLDAEVRRTLEVRGVTIDPATVGHLSGGEEVLIVTRDDGRSTAFRAAFVGAATRQSSDLAAQLGCAFDDTPIGSIIRTDGFKATTVPGIYAAGDCARAPSNISMAMGDGSLGGVAVHQSLVAPAGA